MELLATYMLDDAGEAFNVFYFCTDDHRKIFKNVYYPRDVFKDGTDCDAIPGTVCDHCGKELIAEAN